MVFSLACILLFFLSLVVSGQQSTPGSGVANRSVPAASPEVYRSDAVITVHSDLVLIPVTVTDHKGNNVAGLEKEHFKLFEDTTEQQIVHFAAEDAPASIGIVFDTSGSMELKLGKAREAVNTLLDNAHPDDEFFFVKFNTEARLTVPMTNRVEDIRSQVRELRTRGTTALLDAVRLAIAEMGRARNMRKAIVIISDGDDNASHWSVPELKTAVREHDIVMYTIGIRSPGERSECQGAHLCGAALLRDIAGQTGGRSFEVAKIQQLPDIASKIGGWLRNQYVLGYVPNHLEKDGRYRKVELIVERPKGFPRLNAVWRQGYYAPKE
jgi:VWFA-related protein